MCVNETPIFIVPAKGRLPISTRTKERDEKIVSELRNLKRAMKHLQENQVSEHLDYEDLCIHPNIDLPVRFKPPKFDLFDGIGDPHTHLRAYCDKLVGIGKNEKLIIKLFIRSLSGEALIWYTKQNPRHWYKWSGMAEDFMKRFKFNTEITPDRLSLISIQKKPSKLFQEYARRWRSKVEKVQPSMDESKLTKYFIRSKKGVYFERIMSTLGEKFDDCVKMRNFIEEAINSGKIKSANNSSESTRLEFIEGAKVENEEEGKRNQSCTQFVKPLTLLFEKMRAVNLLQSELGKIPNPLPKWFDETKRCSFHSGVLGNNTEDCNRLRHRIECLIKAGEI
ncbi:uncharacterized protein LOC124898622 [Capsicum annuum]|uniref:uncharacterized protein LOC124898622 n=1 Tax=Capsicum annuum TaxID=4072 RepID=UPI001FB0CD0A|nr:uncharacterized protein LOC124898622 [Capsicum annuum]